VLLQALLTLSSFKSHNGSWYFGSVAGFVFVTNRKNMHDACLSKLDRAPDKSSFCFC